jgi:hypothetical protein
MDKDIKYMGIPNICFSLTTEDDIREEYLKIQRIERGFDDSETWSLRDTIANFIIPRLEAFKEVSSKMVEFDSVLLTDIDLFLNAMKLVSKDKGMLNLTQEEEKELQKGLDAFPKIFMSLWW